MYPSISSSPAPPRNEEFLLRTARVIRIDTGRRRALVARDGEKQEMEMPLVIRHHEAPLQVLVPETGAPAMR